GKRMEYRSSMSSKDFSLKPKPEEVAQEDARFKKYLNQSFRGNINVTNIMLENASTVMLQHDVSSPRPYSRLHIVSGTKAYAQKYPLPAKIAIGEEDFLKEEAMKQLEE